MRHRVAGERRIEVPPAAVWEVLSDFHRVGAWAPRVTRVVPIGPTRRGIGTARRCRIRGLGRVDEVVNVWEEGRRLGYHVTPLGPIGASQSLWEVESDDSGCARVALRLDYDMRFGPLGALAHVLAVRRLLERNLPGALALLRRHVLGGATATAHERVAATRAAEPGR